MVLTRRITSEEKISEQGESKQQAQPTYGTGQA